MAFCSQEGGIKEGSGGNGKDEKNPNGWVELSEFLRCDSTSDSYDFSVVASI